MINLPKEAVTISLVELRSKRSTVPDALGASGGARRWMVLGAACLLQLALGAVYVWSIFAAALGPGGASALNLSSRQVMEPFEAALGMIFFGASLGGWLTDRVGPRVVALSGGVLYSCGVLLASLARAPGEFQLLVLGYGVIGGFGLGIAYVVPAAMLQRWFPDKRALATGIAVAGFGFGGVLTTGVAAPVIARHPVDPAAAFLPLGLIYLFMVLAAGASFGNPPASGPRVDGDGMGLRAALSTPHWYLLTLILFANVAVSIAFIGTAAGGAQVLAGFSPGAAAVLVSVIAVFNGAGRVIWAAVSERVGRVSTFSAMFVLQALCYFGVAFLHYQAMFYVAAVVVGLCCGGGFGIMPATAGDYFGIRHAGGIYGCMLVAWSAGGIIGPRWVSGIITDSSVLAYSTAYAYLGAAAIAGIALTGVAVELPTLNQNLRPEWLVVGQR